MKREIGRNGRQRERSYRGPRCQVPQQSVAQRARQFAFRAGMPIDIFVDETLPSERAGKADDIIVGFAAGFAGLARKPQQFGAGISQEHFELHARQRRRFHRTAEQQVVCKRDDAVGAEQFGAGDRQRPLAGDPRDIGGDDGTLQDEGNRLLLHAERERLAEMRARPGAVAQRLVRIAGIVMAGGVRLVRRNRFREHLHRAPVIAGCLRHQAEKVEALHMRRLARENLTADRLRFAEAARLVPTARLGGEVGDADARRTEGRRARPFCRLVASLAGRPSFFPVHVLSTGPI